MKTARIISTVFSRSMQWLLLPVRRRRAMTKLLSRARHLLDPGNDTSMMPYWALLSRTGIPDRHHELMDAGRRFQYRVERNPEYARQWDHMQQELVATESTWDAMAHFEQISGHTLEPVRRRAVGTPPGHRVSTRRRAVLAGVAAVYLILFFATNATRPDPFAFEPVGLSGYAWEQVGERTRGAAPALDDSTRQPTYASALARARSARKSWLGLFPYYDQSVLAEARRMMATAVDREAGGYAIPPQALESLVIMDDLLQEKR